MSNLRVKIKLNEKKLYEVGNIRGRKEAKELAVNIRDVAKKKVPVATGRLRDSGKVKKGKNCYKVVFDTDYALKIHESYKRNLRSGEKKFLRRAMTEEYKKMKK